MELRVLRYFLLVAQEKDLQQDEDDVHHPGKRTDADGFPAQVQEGRRTGDGRCSQIGFQGDGNAQRHQDQACRGDGIPYDQPLKMFLCHNLFQIR